MQNIKRYNAISRIILIGNSPEVAVAGGWPGRVIGEKGRRMVNIIDNYTNNNYIIKFALIRAVNKLSQAKQWAVQAWFVKHFKLNIAKFE